MISPELIDKHIRQSLLLLQDTKPEDCSLFIKDLGKVLLCSRAGIIYKDDELRQQALTLLDEHVSLACNNTLNFKFAYGVTGLAWTLQYLHNKGIITNEYEPLLEDIDLYIGKSLKWDFEDRLYDLFIGYTGKGIYLLERYAATGSPETRKMLEAIVDTIESTAIQTGEDQVSWLDYYTYRHVKGCTTPFCNIGMAHGVASVICFLASCAKHNIYPDRCIALAVKACNWLLAVQEDGQYKYPYYYVPGRPAGGYNAHYVFSWCYGILPVAICLWMTGYLAGHTLLLEKAYECALLCATKKINEVSVHTGPFDGAKNIHFCHGTFGIAHLFNKFSMMYDDDIFRQATEYWSAKAFEDMERFSVEQLKSDKGLLEGSSGIGMMLMDKIDDRSGLQDWDKIFMLDVQKIKTKTPVYEFAIHL